MARKQTSNSTGTDAQSREDRLKAALKANLARRKAQTRARTSTEAQDKTPGDTGQDKDA